MWLGELEYGMGILFEGVVFDMGGSEILKRFWCDMGRVFWE